MNELRHHLRLTADGKEVVGESGRAEQAVRRLDGSVANSGRTMDRAARQSAGLERRWGGLRGQANAVRAAVAGMIGAFGAREIVRADITLTGLENSLRGVAGTAAGAGAELNYVRGEARRLGLDLATGAKGYAQIQAASKGTILAGQASRDIFEALNETLMVFNKSSAEQERAITAVVQMISKGKVQYEELKGQLAEHIPGATRIMARALGVATSELEKMLERGEVLAEDALPKFARALREEFGEGLAGAISSPRAEFNRLRTDLLEANAEFARAGFMDGLVDAARSARAALADPELRDAANDLSALIGAGFRTAGEAAEFLAENADLVKAGLAGLIALNVGGWAAQTGRAVSASAAAWHAKHFGIVQATRAEALAAAAAVQTARAELAAANMERTRLVSIGQKTAALELGLAAEAAYAGAVARSTAADAAAAAAAAASAKAARIGAGALALIGGPAGAAALAVGGYAYALHELDDRLDPVLDATQAEKDLLEELNRIRGAAVVVTKENAQSLLLEAEAALQSARAMEMIRLQAMSGLRPTVADHDARLAAQNSLAWVPGQRLAAQYTQPRIPLTDAQIEALNIGNDPRLRRRPEGGGDAPGEVVSRAYHAIEAAAGDESLVNRALEDLTSVREAIEALAAADSAAAAAELSSAEEKYQAMLDELALEQEMAGWSDERREVELRARELLAAARKAGRDLSLDEARAIVGETDAAVRHAAALEEWDALQEDFRRTTTMTAAEREVLAKTEEKLNAARAAGIDLTAEQARAEAELEVYAEARRDYADYLDDMREEARLAALPRQQREIELKTMDLLRRAQEAKIALTEQEARAMAAAHVQQMEALEQYQAFTIEMPQLARQAGEEIYRDLTDAFERVFRREGDVVKQFFADMKAIAFRTMAQIAAAMVFRPVFQMGMGGMAGAAAMGAMPAGLGAAGAGGGLLPYAALAGAGAGAGLNLAALNPMGWVNPSALSSSFIGFGINHGLGPGVGSALGYLGTGLGYAGAGLMGAGVGGLAASLLGYNNSASQIGGGLAGVAGMALGGPVGGLIGSLAGGIIGGLFGGKKEPFAESGVDLIGGRFAARGARVDDGGPGEEVAAAAGKIADRLNALLPSLESLGIDVRGAGAGASFGFDDGEYFGGGVTGLKDPEAAAEAVVDRLLADLIAQAGGDIRPDVKRLLEGGADPAEVARAFESLTQQTSAADAALAALENPARAAVMQMMAAQDARLAEVEALRRAGFAVDGLYETVQRLNQAELEKMIADPTRSFAAAIVAMQDPLRGQIDALMAAQAARRDEVLALRETGLAVDGLLMQLDRLDDLELDRALGEIGEAARTAAGELLRIRADLTGWVDRMRTANDNSPYSIQQRRAEAEAQYRDMLARAQGGDQDAIRGITGAADTLLALDRQATSSAADRLALYEEVLADIGALGAAETDADRIVAAINGLSASLPPALAADLFAALDTSGLGKIDYVRFAAFFGASQQRLDALQAILGPGFDVANANLDDIFALIDFNGDGQISQMELINARLVASIQTEQKVVNAVLALGGNIPPALAAELFRTLDASGLGKIDYVRFAQFFGASEDRLEAISAILGLGFDITAAQLSAVFGALDTNGDGTIDQLEFLNAQVAAQNAQLKAPKVNAPPPASSGPTGAQKAAALNKRESWALQQLLAAVPGLAAEAQKVLSSSKGPKYLSDRGYEVSPLGVAAHWWDVHSGGVVPFASGAVFESGIYREPQLFRFNGGRTGVRFEAGDEFLAPAVRMPDGQMGVRAIGGGDARLTEAVRGMEREQRATRDLVAALVRVVADGNAATLDALMRSAELTADQKRLVEQQVNLARTAASRSAA